MPGVQLGMGNFALRGGASTVFDLELIGDTSQVDQMLQLLDRCFSPAGMERFLGTDVVEIMRDRAKNTFAQEGSRSVGGKWRPLKARTVQVRTEGIRRGEWPLIGPSHPINKRTGDMEEYITEGRGDVYHTSASSALYYPQRPQPPKTKGLRDKVRRAQVGGGRGGTPPRPVLGVSELDMNLVLVKLARFIERGGV